MKNLHVKQQGLGLVELMISISLGLFLISGAIGVFVSSKTSYSINNELTAIQDNARFATTVLTREFRMAGFYGCTGSHGIVSTLNPVSDSGWYLNFSQPMQGWDGDDPSYPTPEFPEAYNSEPVSGFPESDIVTIRRGDNQAVEVKDNDPPNSATIDIEGTHPYDDGDILVISDCTKTSIFQVTGNNSNKIVHNKGKGSPGNCTKKLGSSSTSSSTFTKCPTSGSAFANQVFLGSDGAFILKMVARAYYISEGSDGTPTLYRRELSAEGGDAELEDEEIVQGIENLQVLYGYDTDSDGYANRYVSASDVADWNEVYTVRFHLLFRSLSQTASEPQNFRFVGTTYTPTDKYLRQEFVSTIELRNKG